VLSLPRDAGRLEPFEQGQLTLGADDGRDAELDVLTFAVIGTMPELARLAPVEPSAGELGAEKEAAQVVVAPARRLAWEVAEGVEGAGGVRGGAAVVDEDGDRGPDRPCLVIVNLEAMVSAVAYQAVAVGRWTARPPALADPCPQAVRRPF
jgi:hypothetical protein